MAVGSFAILPPTGTRQRGFTYLLLLIALALLAIATQGVVTYASQQAQRERESELMRIGNTFASAIGSYYEATPGSVKRWPSKLQDLLEDQRQVSVHRHIRDIYADPITRQANWGLIFSNDGGISGVYSLSQDRVIKGNASHTGIGEPGKETRYSDWKFIYIPKHAYLGTGLPSQ